MSMEYRNYTQEQVNAGVALLNERNPEWYKNIDVSKLNMCDDNNNLISQIYGASYAVSLKKLMGAKKSKGFKNLFAKKDIAEKGYIAFGYGFCIQTGSDGESKFKGQHKDLQNGILTAFWRIEIMKLQGTYEGFLNA